MVCINLPKLHAHCIQLDCFGSNIHTRFNLYHYNFNGWNLPSGYKALYKWMVTWGRCNSYMPGERVAINYRLNIGKFAYFLLNSAHGFVRQTFLLFPLFSFVLSFVPPFLLSLLPPSFPSSLPPNKQYNFFLCLSYCYFEKYRCTLKLKIGHSICRH